MEPGQAYLIHCGDWHTYCGRCVRQVGPLAYRFDLLSKIDNTNGGDNWHELAAGDTQARSRAAYLHYDVAAVIPLSIAAFEWRGELPHPKAKGA